MKKFSLLCILLFLVSCSAAYHQNQLASGQEEAMPVGTAQYETRGNMDRAEMAEPLGSPYPVTTDKKDNGTCNQDQLAAGTANSSESVSQACEAGEVGGKKLLMLKLFFN